jgi:tRNA(Ile2) C34 agmatinyltransferase TiaS
MASMTGSRRAVEFRCKACGKVFATEDMLEAHKRMEHGKESHPPAGVG